MADTPLTIDDFTEDELRDLGTEQENYLTLENLCCQCNVYVMCEMSFYGGKPNYIADVDDMAEALIRAKENRAEYQKAKAERDAMKAAK